MHVARNDLHFERRRGTSRIEPVTLAGLLCDHGPLPVPLAAELIVQVCDTLVHAHACGVVHGDITPSKIVVQRMVDGRFEATLLGFGEPHALTGSPGYASPEQLTEQRDVDGRADIWALGAVLYELVSDRPAFAAECLEETRMAAVRGPAWPMPNAHATVSHAFEELLRRCLRVDRASRFAAVEDMRASLATFSALCRPRFDGAESIVSVPVVWDVDDAPPATERIPFRVEQDVRRTVLLPPIVPATPVLMAKVAPVAAPPREPAPEVAPELVTPRGYLFKRALVPIALLAAAVGLQLAHERPAHSAHRARPAPSATAPAIAKATRHGGDLPWRSPDRDD